MTDFLVCEENNKKFIEIAKKKLNDFIELTKHPLSNENKIKTEALIEVFINRVTREYKLIKDVEVRDGHYSVHDGYYGDIDIVFGEEKMLPADEEDQYLHFAIPAVFPENVEENTVICYLGYIDSIHSEEFEEKSKEFFGDKYVSKENREAGIIFDKTNFYLTNPWEADNN